MKTKTDLVYQDLKLRLLAEMLTFTNNPTENFKILDKELSTVNLTKCSLHDLEMEIPGSFTYLIYLLQTNHKVNFGVCPKLKVWFNQAGLQNRCQHEDRLMMAHCFGVMDHCSIPANKP
ncbi:MAG: hypothetical protein WC564_02545 [Patescibacteria group bacterium]